MTTIHHRTEELHRNSPTLAKKKNVCGLEITSKVSTTDLKEENIMSEGFKNTAFKVNLSAVV